MFVNINDILDLAESVLGTPTTRGVYYGTPSATWGRRNGMPRIPGADIYVCDEGWVRVDIFSTKTGDYPPWVIVEETVPDASIIDRGVPTIRDVDALLANRHNPLVVAPARIVMEAAKRRCQNGEPT